MQDFIDLTLPWLNQETKKIENITLSEELKKGKLVLAFFPAAWTGVCTKEMCTFRDSLKEFESLNATVLGISVDLPWALERFSRDLELNFKLLSDANKEAIKKYQTIWPDLAGVKNVANRSIFVIDSDGKVSYQWIANNPGEMPPFDGIKKSLQS